MLPQNHLKKIHQAQAALLRDFGRSQKTTSSSVYRYLTSYCLRPSKGVRALLLLLSYLGYTQIKPTPALYRWVSSLELIQNFVLIHDDLIDHTTMRRGGPVLQRGLAHLNSDDEVLGKNLALICGDLLFSLGIRTFLDIDVAKDRKEKALKILLDCACVTALGEVNDLLGNNLAAIKKETVYRLYDQKTGEYSFITPLICGSIAAGQNDSEIKKLDTLGRLLGRAFQMRDDLQDLTTDLHDSRTTLLAYYAYQGSAGAEQKQMVKIFQRKNKTAKEITYLKNLFRSSGAMVQVQREQNDCLVLSREIIKSLHLRNTEKDELSRLIEKIKV